MMVLLTTYLNAGEPDGPVVSATSVLRMPLMICVFQASVDAWLYAVTEESAVSQAWGN